LLLPCYEGTKPQKPAAGAAIKAVFFPQFRKTNAKAVCWKANTLVKWKTQWKDKTVQFQVEISLDPLSIYFIRFEDFGLLRH
jgi:hypothetical protein